MAFVEGCLALKGVTGPFDHLLQFLFQLAVGANGHRAVKAGYSDHQDLPVRLIFTGKDQGHPLDLNLLPRPLDN